MEAERTQGPAAADAAHPCIGCGHAVDEARCGHCGIAVKPGGWTLVRQIASGPHSRMFLAEKDGKQAALKELVFALVPDAALLEGFEREARLLAQLKHPAIPRFVESFTEGKGVHTRLYLAQEFVRGTSLLDALKDHRFDEAEGKALARSLLDVLAYLHGLSPRVIHRDLKPANVMRRPDGALALVDFGAARDLVRGVTHGSTLVGTFGYMPPEQLGGTVDLTSDLYALGATLVHLLSRRPPDELLKPGMGLGFEDDVNVSDGFRAWLRKLTERERGDRYQTTKAARDALDALDQKAVPRPKPARTDATPVSDRGPLMIAAAVVALVCTVGLWLSVSGGKKEEAQSAPAPIVAVAAVPKPMQVVAAPPPKQVVAAAPRSSDVTTVQKVKLAPFEVTTPFTVPVAATLPITANDCTGASFEVKAIGAVPGSLLVSSALENTAAAGACANVYLEVTDSTGARDASRAALLSNAKQGTTAQRETKLKLPENHKKVTLRVGPQAKPYAVFDVDLAKGTAVKR